MSKKGMHRPEIDRNKPPKNDVPPVPELQGAPKRTKEKAKPVAEK